MKGGRIMLRAAALQFVNYHYGPVDIDDDFLEIDEQEIEYLKNQRRAPHLSDEFMDD